MRDGTGSSNSNNNLRPSSSSTSTKSSFELALLCSMRLEASDEIDVLSFTVNCKRKAVDPAVDWLFSLIIFDPSAARIESRPSVSAAGPGCRISADLVSTMRSFRTAGIASQPDRCRILSGMTLLAAPRGKNDVGRCSDHVPWRNDTVFGSHLFSQFGERLLATGDLDEFRDPVNPADERIVPLLEINLRLRPATNKSRHLTKANFIPPSEPFRLIRHSDQSAEGANHCKNAMPARISSTAIGAWRSEKVKTRSGSSAMISECRPK
jgi:hypothetical protein